MKRIAAFSQPHQALSTSLSLSPFSHTSINTVTFLLTFAFIINELSQAFGIKWKCDRKQNSSPKGLSVNY